MQRVVLATLVLIAMTPIAISAQTIGEHGPGDFASFWARFKTAVAAGDKKAVASMMKFPLPYESDELSEREFIKDFNDILDSRVKRRLQRAIPVKDGKYYKVTCGPYAIFWFEKIGGEFKFVEISIPGFEGEV